MEENQTFEEVMAGIEGVTETPEGYAASEEQHSDTEALEPSVQEDADRPATKAEVDRIYKDLNKGMQKALREVAELAKRIEQAKQPETDSIGDGLGYEDPIEAIRKELRELKSHFEQAAGMTARAQAEATVRQLAARVADGVSSRFGVQLTGDEVYEAAENSDLPAPQTLEQVERMLELTAMDIVLRRHGGKPQPKPAPTVQKATGAPAQSLEPAEPDVNSLSTFEEIYKSFRA